SNGYWCSREITDVAIAELSGVVESPAVGLAAGSGDAARVIPAGCNLGERQSTAHRNEARAVVGGAVAQLAETVEAEAVGLPVLSHTARCVADLRLRQRREWDGIRNGDGKLAPVRVDGCNPRVENRLLVL